ncbi:MAG: Bug family tripartite tricarboxylate transporter substrate binding protein [Lautropia sp.]
MTDCSRKATKQARLATAATLVALASAALVAPARAQGDWPAKPVRIVVPFAAGGTTDITARVTADYLTQTLKQTFVVDNRGGAGGNIGATEVAKAAPDGYTFLMGTPGTQAINQFLYSKMPYDTAKDFVPVSFVVRVPNVLVVNPKNVQARTLTDFLAEVKSKPGKLAYGSPGNGTTGHLSTELLKGQAGIEVTHVPYKGSGPMLQDLMGGQIDMAIDNLPSAMPQIKAGRLAALGVTSTTKVDSLPDAQPIASAVPGYAAESWFVLMAPAGTPAAIVDKLSAEVDRMIKQPAIIERFKGLGAEPVGGTPASLGKFIAEETSKWAKVVKASGAKID